VTVTESLSPDGRSEDDFMRAIMALWPRSIDAPDTCPPGIALCDAAIAAYPGNARFHICRGDLLQMSDIDAPWPLEEALHCYERATAIDPRNDDAWFELGMFWDVVMANPRKARQFLHKAFLLRRARASTGAAR
jgi:hypothetical protein